MELTIAFTDEEKQRLLSFATARNVKVEEAVRQAVLAALPYTERETGKGHAATDTEKNTVIPPMPKAVITQPLNIRHPTEEDRLAAIAYFDEQIKRAQTLTLEEIKAADEEFEQLMQNLQEWR